MRITTEMDQNIEESDNEEGGEPVPMEERGGAERGIKILS